MNLELLKMLVFIIPIKSSKVATSWPELCKLFERCLRSVCNQTSQEFRVVVICNEKPNIEFHHSKVTYLESDFPVPKSDYLSKNIDKCKKITVGLLSLQELQPTHIMVVDADDCVSRRIASFVSQHSDENGWFVDSGYEYKDGNEIITIRRKEFYKMCGTCNIINYRLLTLPERMLPYDQLTYDRFLTGHPLARPDLAERGTPLQPLPFPGTIYVRDRIGESISMQEPFLAKLKRDPREAMRGIKKGLLAAFNDQPLTDEIREEFGLYPLL